MSDVVGVWRGARWSRCGWLVLLGFAASTGCSSSGTSAESGPVSGAAGVAGVAGTVTAGGSASTAGSSGSSGSGGATAGNANEGGHAGAVGAGGSGAAGEGNAGGAAGNGGSATGGGGSAGGVAGASGGGASGAGGHDGGGASGSGGANGGSAGSGGSGGGQTVQVPTVTNVVVTSTNPANGIIPYDTGTATVKITGTQFGTVSCPDGVKLDDTDALGTPVGTLPTTCNVDSDTQITATFPAGIRSNGAVGWNVRVTNSAGSNITSSVAFTPRAGLLLSEIYTGTSGATDHEFFELYNPTQTSIDIQALGLRVHFRNANGSDTSKTLTVLSSGSIPSHGFFLVISTASTVPDAWVTYRDATYTVGTADLVANGGMYISLSATSNVKVIDRVGWGSQISAAGYEGAAAAANIPSGSSIERKPAGGLGHATDTDDNSADFNSASTLITPRGSANLAQP